MRSVVFTDLDETLLHSLRRHAAQSGDTLAAVDKAGAPVSYQTPRQAALFQWMARADRVIAVTGRSAGAYARVRLPLVHEAIVHHGAMVLGADGVADPAYTDVVQRDLDEASAGLDAAWEHVHAWLMESGVPLRAYRQVIDGRTVEVCVKHVSPDAVSLGEPGERLSARWRTLGDTVRVHHNGNNLALLPAKVDKLRAVRWLRVRLEAGMGPFFALGAGDSVTDHPFMAACDAYLVPSGSQLDQVLARTGGMDAG